MKRGVAVLGLAVAGGALFAAPALAADCSALARMKLPDGSIVAATAESGGFTSPKDGLGATTKVGAPFCRVQGIAKSEPTSSIAFELWLPPPDKWNGRLLASGDLGQSGAPNYPALNEALNRGFAALGDNLGHNSSAFASDWAVGHPERVKDFGSRGSHYSAIAAKAIVDAYYGSGPKHSYFIGCSHGGGSALAEAQRYPGDYDGIVAGAFGTNWTGVNAAYVYEAQAALDDPASHLSKDKLALLGKAAVAACDAEDGVKDGLISRPGQCHFDPAVLQCKAGDAADCLTAPQVDAAKKLYQGPRDSAGHQIYAGLEPGSEFMWSFLVAGPNTFLGGDFFKYMVYDGKGDFDWHKFSLDRDYPAAVRKLSADIDNLSGDLAPFVAHGGRLIMYNGWADGLIQPGNAIQYYGSVEKAAGGKAESFARLYLAPGMGHCAAGPGPNAFGGLRYLNAGQPNPPVLDPQHDLLSAIVAWVEQGKAPDAIIATKFNGDDASKGIAMQRPLCPYPQVAKYDGHGDPDKAASFACATPPQ